MKKQQLIAFILALAGIISAAAGVLIFFYSDMTVGIVLSVIGIITAVTSVVLKIVINAGNSQKSVKSYILPIISLLLAISALVTCFIYRSKVNNVYDRLKSEYRDIVDESNDKSYRDRFHFSKKALDLQEAVEEYDKTVAKSQAAQDRYDAIYG